MATTKKPTITVAAPSTLQIPPPPPLVPMPQAKGSCDRRAADAALCSARDLELLQPLAWHMEAAGRGIAPAWVPTDVHMAAARYRQAQVQVEAQAEWRPQRGMMLREDLVRITAQVEAALMEQGYTQDDAKEKCQQLVKANEFFFAHSVDKVLDTAMPFLPLAPMRALVELSRATLLNDAVLLPEWPWRPEAMTGALLASLYIPNVLGMAKLAQRLAAGQGAAFDPEAALHLFHLVEKLWPEWCDGFSSLTSFIVVFTSSTSLRSARLTANGPCR